MPWRKRWVEEGRTREEAGQRAYEVSLNLAATRWEREGDRGEEHGGRTKGVKGWGEDRGRGKGGRGMLSSYLSSGRLSLPFPSL